MSDLYTLLGTVQIKWIATLIVIDVVLGILAALIKKDFRLGKLADFMVKPVLGYIFGFVVLEMLLQGWPCFTQAVSVAFALVILTLLGSILKNLAKMGLPLSNWLK